jgi:probable phosphoglycerate mutase
MRELREWNFGSWEGQPNADLWTPVFAAHGYTYVPGSADYAEMTADGLDSVIDAIHESDPLGRAESATAVTTRLTVALATILAEAERVAGFGDVLVVTHGAVLGSILRHILPRHRPVAGFPNCGVVTVTWREGVPDVSEVVAGPIATTCPVLRGNGSQSVDLTAKLGNSRTSPPTGSNTF